jgi:hypothetical protein
MVFFAIVLMFSVGSILAAPREAPIPASTLLGKPTIEPDTSVSLYIWIDVDGLHVRWTTAGKPVLFSGRLSLDRPLKDLKRVLDVGSGWVNNHGDRTVIFSATSRNGVDGFDLAVPHGQKANLDLRIDGNDPSLDQVFLGGAKTKPAEIPMVVLLR